MPNKVPPVRSEFRRAAQGQPSKVTTNIATSAELSARQKLREKPAPKLSPPGYAAPGSKDEAQRQNEKRIVRLQTQLGTAKDKFERNFDRARRGR